MRLVFLLLLTSGFLFLSGGCQSTSPEEKAPGEGKASSKKKVRKIKTANRGGGEKEPKLILAGQKPSLDIYEISDLVGYVPQDAKRPVRQEAAESMASKLLAELEEVLRRESYPEKGEAMEYKRGQLIVQLTLIHHEKLREFLKRKRSQMPLKSLDGGTSKKN